MTIPRRLAVSVLPMFAFLAVGCSGGSSSTATPGATCSMNSECAQGLTCSFGRCQAACKEARDCPNGEQCVKNASGINSCLVPEIETCSYNSQCLAPLVCGADFKCRNQCLADRDCATATQKCVLPDGVCAEPTAINADGTLKGAVASGDAGAQDTAGVLDALAGGSPDLPATQADAPTGDRVPDLAASPAPDVAPSAPDAVDAAQVCSNSCDDGLACTTDTCAGGVCKNTLNTGYCLIDKACYMDGDNNPSDPCKACNMTTSTSAWTPKSEGAPCGVGKSCQSSICTACGNVGQACCGATKPGTCSVGGACNSSTNLCEADKAIDISGSANSFCVLLSSGRVRCWGSSGPMLGASAASSTAAPPIPGILDAVNISVGPSAACAVRSTGSVLCWGTSLPGGGSSTVPSVVSGVSNAKQVSVASSHACVRASDGKVVCWGDNSKGQRGDSAGATSPTVPAAVPNGTDVLSIAACGNATCVLHTSGQVSCTGAAYQNGQSADSTTLVDLPSVSNAGNLSCGSDEGASFCAVAQTGAVAC